MSIIGRKYCTQEYIEYRTVLGFGVFWCFGSQCWTGARRCVLYYGDARGILTGLRDHRTKSKITLNMTSQIKYLNLASASASLDLDYE